jgi:hypothetical protein
MHWAWVVASSKVIPSLGETPSGKDRIDVFDTMKGQGAQAKVWLAVVALVGGGVVLLAPGVAGAKAAPNTFTFGGAYSGTLKLTPSSLNCIFGKSYSGKGFLVTLSHMKGTISGAGSGPWAATFHVAKQGTNHVASAELQSLTNSSFQNSGVPITAIDETSGTITYKGSKGSINLTVESHTVGSSTYGATGTVTGSWSC